MYWRSIVSICVIRNLLIKFLKSRLHDGLGTFLDSCKKKGHFTKTIFLEMKLYRGVVNVPEELNLSLVSFL